MAPQDEDGAEYASAWGAIGAALEGGTSWSGHERSRAWWNGRGVEFHDTSAVWGLDHIEDGRVALQIDWDGDGDLDLWLRFRNGPTLRFMENRSERPEWMLEVPPGLARNSVATVRVTGDVQPAVLSHKFEVTARARPVSDGYLAAADRGLRLSQRDGLFLLGVHVETRDGEVAEARIDDSARDIVSSDGTPRNLNRVTLVRRDGMWRVTSNDAEVRDLSGVEIGGLATVPLPTRVVLRTPLGLPQERVAALGRIDGGRLLVVRSTECAVCEATVPAFLEAVSARDGAAPVTTVVLEDQDEARTADFALSAVESILGPGAEVALPVGLLIDRGGALQAVYTGALDAETLERDTRDFALGAVRGAERTGVGRPGGARWFHGAPRDYAPLIRALRASGLDSDADVYTRARDGR